MLAALALMGLCACPAQADEAWPCRRRSRRRTASRRASRRCASIVARRSRGGDEARLRQSRLRARRPAGHAGDLGASRLKRARKRRRQGEPSDRHHRRSDGCGTLFLTLNTTTVYAFTCLDLSTGPMVLDVPTSVLGPVDDAYFRSVTDIASSGRMPGAADICSCRRASGTNCRRRNISSRSRATTRCSSTSASSEGWRYRRLGRPCQGGHQCLSDERDDHEQRDADVGIRQHVGPELNTISANDSSFYDELNQLVQAESVDFVDPDKVGLPVAPDARMKAILTDAAAVGNATAHDPVREPRSPDQVLPRPAMADALRRR